MSLRVVIDGRVAIKWTLPESDAELAKRLLAPGIDRIGPDFVLLEVANGLWRNERLGRVPSPVVDLAIRALPRYFHRLHSSADLQPEASALARDLDHPVYDCLYVVLARRTGARVVTTDARLLAKLARTPDAARVVALADCA